MSFILSLISEFLIGMFNGWVGGTLQDVFRYLSRFGRHL